jgi:hypothetical protein
MTQTQLDASPWTDKDTRNAPAHWAGWRTCGAEACREEQHKRDGMYIEGAVRVCSDVYLRDDARGDATEAEGETAEDLARCRVVMVAEARR